MARAIHTLGTASDAMFIWMYQDSWLFLLPTIVVVMLAVERLVTDRHHLAGIAWTAIADMALPFVGCLISAFVAPTPYGVGNVIATIGLLVVGLSLLATLWWSQPATGTQAMEAPAVPGGTTEAPVEARRESVTI